MNSFRLVVAACVIAAFVSSTAHARLEDGATFNRDILLIQFEEPPLSEYSGGIDGLRGTSREATGGRLDPDSPESVAYRDWLLDRQNDHLDTISNQLGRPVDVIFRYDILMNGVAIRARSGDFARVKEVDAVKAVSFDINYPLHTDRGPTWIGATGVWNGSGTGGLGDTKGEGIVIGVLDTGVNFGHPSYSDNPADGHVYVNPNGQNNFLGWCNPGHPDFDPSYTCNNKLIGAWDYADAASGGIETDGPVDDDGHGSHTSSTAGGNTLTSPAISGVAPHANVIMYDTCYIPSPGALGTCPFSATSAAAQQALIDGVNVINYSIGGGSIPWSVFDIDSFFLDLVANGIFVSASAGNAGPTAGTVGHNGPWVSASGASSHDRQAIQNMLTNMSGGNSPPANISGQSRTSGYGPETVVYAGDFSNGDPDPEQCLTAFPPGTWTSGEIVLCDRGTIARVLKCFNVAQGGAGGCILADVAGSGGTVADPHVIPAIHVNEANGNTLRNWLASGSNHMATITAGTIITNPAVGDIMAGFSSRGPGPYNVLKPDVTNPGSNIFAALQAGSVDPSFPGPDFGTLSGTSMSSPHTAGSAALLMALHPSWTPVEVKSALMTTAKTAAVFKENGTTPADPFDRGSGRVQLGPASQAALVLDESEANFLAANPDEGGDPRALNLATMKNSTCATTCFFTRTVKNARSFATQWTFADTSGANVDMTATPNSFSLNAGQTQEIEFAVTITGGGGGFVFGEGTFNETGADAPSAHFTAAVRQSGLDASPVRIETLLRDGMQLHEGVVSTGASDLQLNVAGLAPLSRTGDEVAQDPTNNNPYDNATGTVTYILEDLVGARRIHASTLNSEAPDLDLYVGRDLNMDGIAQANEQVCVSGSPAATEKCEVIDPQDGDWWVLVQNWLGSGAPTDAFTVRLGVVTSSDEGNLSAAASDTSPAAGEPFDVTVTWNFAPNEGNGEYIGVLDFGTSPGNEGDLGSITVDYINDRIAASGFE